MTNIISALPFNLINGTTADASQVMANLNQIVNDVNENAQTKTSSDSINLLGITEDTTFTLPAYALVTNIYVYVVSGILSSGSVSAILINSLNPYPNFTSDLSATSLPAGSATTTPGMIGSASGQTPVSNVSLATTFDLSDGITLGNGFNGATINVVMQYIIIGP